MHIKKIILDGFKSYAVRTELTNFDQNFNAITGLNGSGKSNILDAICFVMGVKNFSLMRIRNANELVYKNGQAGVTKASVTLEFDNNDVSQSPLGYEEYQTISVSRVHIINTASKWKINGRTAAKKKVTDFFTSVGLNINNAHFLIMQGKITQILNMNNRQILDMIEEAAGTAIFNVKQDRARKTMNKKDEKLITITRLLSEEIEPELRRLTERSERIEKARHLRESLRVNERKYVAFQYCQFEDLIEREENITAELEKEKKTFLKQVDDLLEKIEDLTGEIQELNDSSEAQQLNEEVAAMEKQLETVKREIQAHKATETRKRKELNTLGKKSVTMMTKNRDLEKEYRRLGDRVSNNRSSLKDLVDQHQVKKHSVHELAKYTRGIEDERGAVVDIDTIAKEVTNLRMKHEGIQLNINSSTTRLKSFEDHISNSKNEYDRITDELETAKATASAIKIPRVPQDAAEQFEELSQFLLMTHQNIKKKEAGKRNYCDRYKCHPIGVSLPDNIDMSKVFGRVYSILNVQNEDMIAVEHALGTTNLEALVVEDHVTQRAIVNHLKRQRGITLKIFALESLPKRGNNRQLRERILRDCQRNSNMKLIEDCIEWTIDHPQLAVLASNLVGLSVMGKDISMDFIENKVLRSYNIRYYDMETGDVFTPSGRSIPGRKMVTRLNKMRDYHFFNEEIAQLKISIEEINVERSQVEGPIKAAREAEYRQTQANELVDTLEQRLSLCRYVKMTEKKERTENELKTFKDQLEATKASLETRKKSLEIAKSVQSGSVDYESLCESLEKERTELADIESRLSKHEKDTGKMEERYNKMGAEIEMLDIDISKNKELQERTRDEHHQAIDDVADKQKERRELSDTVDRLVSQKSTHRNEIRIKQQEKSKCVKMHDEFTLAEQRTQAKLESSQRALEEHQKDFASFTSMDQTGYLKYADQFGVPHSEFDWGERTGEELKTLIDQLHKDLVDYDDLADVDGEVFGLRLRTTMKEFEALSAKKERLREDREQIFVTMDTIAQKKNDTIVDMYTRVSSRFGDMFSMLLPGSHCSLQPIYNSNEELSGLSLGVSLGGHVKESLTELSGGQRSLLALSLILALLRCSPAPIYILDEVDAALDPSHTSNLGRLIHEQFPQSQFLVVSLKEDMFNHAPVIFKTEFSGNTSMVRRLEGQ
ncbi:hypothetical protein PCE1_001926 [Barthelona sp. PCE]